MESTSPNKGKILQDLKRPKQPIIPLPRAEQPVASCSNSNPDSPSKEENTRQGTKRSALQIVPVAPVTQPITTDGRVIVTERTDFTFTWTIVNFGEVHDLIEDRFISSMFPDHEDAEYNFSWVIQLYPRGCAPEFRDYLSMKVWCRNPYKQYIRTFCRFDIVDRNYEKVYITECELVYVQTGQYSIYKFMEKDRLEREKNNLMPDGVLVIICTIRAYLQTTRLTTETEENLNSFSEDFKKLYLNPKFTDYKLISGKREFPAHRYILSARSTFFRAVFDVDTASDSTVITDVNTTILRELLCYIYTDKVKTLKNLQKNAMKLMMASDRYGVHGCKNMCEKILCKQVKVENALDLLLICHEYTARYLQEEVFRVIYANPREIVKAPKYKIMKRKHMDIMGTILKTLEAWETVVENEALFQNYSHC